MKTHAGKFLIFEVYGPAREYDFSRFTDSDKAIEFAQEWLAEVFDQCDDDDEVSVSIKTVVVTEARHAQEVADELAGEESAP